MIHPGAMGAELYLFEPGHYKLTLLEKQGGEMRTVGETPFEVAGPRSQVKFEIPGNKALEISIRKTTN